MLSRRRFVNAAAATLVAASVPTFLAPEAAAAAGTYSAAWWRKRLGTKVQFQGEQWHLGELVAVKENQSSSAVEQFTIVFQGSANDRIPEGVYVVQVAKNKVKLFVQPTGGDIASNRYVAAVARLR